MKGTPTVLDFVNAPRRSGSPSSRTTPTPTSRPAPTRTSSHDIVTTLDEAAIYTQDDLDAVARAVHEGKGSDTLTSAVAPVKQRYTSRRTSALTENGGQGDAQALDALDVFCVDFLYSAQVELLVGDVARAFHAIVRERRERAGSL